MRNFIVWGFMIILLTTSLTAPARADIIIPEKRSGVHGLEYLLSRTPTLGIPYIRGVADSKFPNKLVVLQHYYDLAKDLLENPEQDIELRSMNVRSRQVWERALRRALDILEANILLVKAEQQPPDVARRIYIAMVNDEQQSLEYRAEALRRLEDDPPKEIAQTLPVFLPGWEQTPSGRRYWWKVHPEITLRAVRMMKKVCGKEILPILDDWLRDFQRPDIPFAMSVGGILHDALVDLYWDLRLAGLSVEEKIKIAIDELLKWKGHGLVPREAFVKIGKPAVPHLIKLLYIPDRRINGSAEWALGKIRDERAIEHLARLMDDPIYNPTPLSRSITVETIGEIGGTKAAAILRQVLKRQNEHPYVLQGALNGLGKIGDTSAEGLILPFLEHPDENVRWCAANALKTCGTQKAVPFLLKRLEVETVPSIRSAIIQALKALGVQVKN